MERILMPFAQNGVIMFDGVCRLCNVAVRFVIKIDKNKKFHFLSLQSELGIAYLSYFDLPKEYSEGIVLIIGEKIHLKSTAVLTILKECGGMTKLLYFLILVPRPIRDFLYDIVAKYRYKIFGENSKCLIPSEK